MNSRAVIGFATTFLLFLAAPVAASQPSSTDWLIDNRQYRARFESMSSREDHFRFTNGLVSREFLIREGTCATIGLKQLTADQSLLRAVRSEARITVDGEEFNIGGLVGQPNQAFLRLSWLDQMQPANSPFEFKQYLVSNIVSRLDWARIRHHGPNVQWPPPGKQVTLHFETRPGYKPAMQVNVCYTLYDGIPLFSKWIEVINLSDQPVVLDRFTSEVLAVTEEESRVEFREGVRYPDPQFLHVETDFAFGGFHHANANRHIVHWREDPEYQTQVNYLRKTPCLLEVQPTYGPAQTIGTGKKGKFTSCRTFELLYDSTDRERRSLSLRRMYRTLAPWVTENPLMHHMRTADPEEVRRAIDDAAEVGFEMIILSFGSGFNIEDDSSENINRWREIAEHAKSKGVEIGGYSLLSSRRIGDGNDIVSPPGMKPTHGNCPALTSDWGIRYFQKLVDFFEQTGFTLLEHDGPYPGDVDVTPRPPWQKGEEDSRWVQAQIANQFYRHCRKVGIYVNAPDYYYLNGTSKCGMGYREVNWSLPRAMQVIHTRQNIYDGSWYKTPSMGWMFVPLTEYHGGGDAATIEPLNKHLDHYARMMDCNLGLGVQACYRGPRLFDTQETKAMVKAKVDWFKKYRNILESDLIHGRRADGQDLDWMLHVNPQLDRKGMLVVYNPTDREITRHLRIPLYYAGISEQATIKPKDRQATNQRLDRDYKIEFEVTVEANGMNWFVIE